MRIFFTGGSGKAGRHVVAHLAERGHQVTNADLVPLGHPAVADLRIDLTDIGQAYSAMSGSARMTELDLAEKPDYDAVVHFAAVPAILRTSEARTFETNVLSTYNVLEAATRLGIGKIVFASSEATYGICFAQGERRPHYLPVDEDHPTVPEDSYAMSKVANEVTARSFQARRVMTLTARSKRILGASPKTVAFRRITEQKFSPCSSARTFSRATLLLA